MLGLPEETGEKLSRGKQLDGVVRQNHNCDEAERILRAGLRHFGLEPGQLVELRKNDPRKRAIARVIRRRTTVDNGLIARQLAMGHPSAVSRSLQPSPDETTQEAGLFEAIEKQQDAS